MIKVGKFLQVKKFFLLLKKEKFKNYQKKLKNSAPILSLKKKVYKY